MEKSHYFLSQEFLNPLTPIHGYLSLLLNEKYGEVDPKQRKALLSILHQLHQLRTALDYALDTIRIEAGSPLELKKETFLLDDLIKAVIEEFSPAISARAIKLQFISQNNPIPISADRQQLRVVLNNLLGNATKFTPSKGSIRISIDKIKNQIQVGITDSGIGIAFKDLENVFERFYQVESPHVRAAGGIGMGLTIARNIVRAHGGEIWAESEGPGKGSTLIFSIPEQNQKSA